MRKITGGGPAVREEVYRYDEPTHFSYGLVSGAPVRDHRGDVVLEERAGGTFMTYGVTFDAALPLRLAMLGAMRAAIAMLAGAVAKESERRAVGAAAVS